MPDSSRKPKLLVMALWQLGDLVIATPFLRAASEKYEVTVISKPFGKDLQARFWPEVRVVPFMAPWTAFKRKYRLYAWPWRDFFQLYREVRKSRFEVGLSARWDPRDHMLLALAGIPQRLGFPRLGSRMFLNQPLERPDPEAHQYEYWRVIGRALGLQLPAREKLVMPAAKPGRDEILVHSGAGQPVRVWSLERYLGLVRRLRQKGHRVLVVCDPDQQNWWVAAGEKNIAVPHTVTELLALMDRARLFIGNDSGPGHLAAMAGVPTFSVFGPQLPEWFAPLHPAAEWIEGKACPYKPCSDYCRFATPRCLGDLSEEEVWARVERFVSSPAP